MSLSKNNKIEINKTFLGILTSAIFLCACGNADFVNEAGAGSSQESMTTSVAAQDEEEDNQESQIIDSRDSEVDNPDAADEYKDESAETANSEQESELQHYISMYENDEITLDELDDKRAELRLLAAKPYEETILEDYLAEYDYNDRTIGHIRIDKTEIDAPVLQTLEDYEYYLHRDIDGVESEPGCIILDADSEIGIGTAAGGYLVEYEPSPIQLVHGHNMRNGTMFGSLLKYENENYGLAHNIIHYDSIYEKREYELVCAFYSRIYPKEEDVFKYYDIEGINTFDKSYNWFKNVEELALYKTDVEVNEGDELIVLSTCAYQVEEGRFAVVGKRVK